MILKRKYLNPRTTNGKSGVVVATGPRILFYSTLPVMLASNGSTQNVKTQLLRPKVLFVRNVIQKSEFIINLIKLNKV